MYKGCGAKRQAHVMLSPPLTPHFHPLACFLTNPKHCLSLHQDDETPHNPQCKFQVEDTNCGQLFQRVERYTHNVISMWKTQIPIVSKVEKSGKMHKSIKKWAIKMK
jgi:hypothetical protein